MQLQRWQRIWESQLSPREFGQSSTGMSPDCKRSPPKVLMCVKRPPMIEWKPSPTGNLMQLSYVNVGWAQSARSHDESQDDPEVIGRGA